MVGTSAAGDRRGGGTQTATRGRAAHLAPAAAAGADPAGRGPRPVHGAPAEQPPRTGDFEPERVGTGGWWALVRIHDTATASPERNRLTVRLLAAVALVLAVPCAAGSVLAVCGHGAAVGATGGAGVLGGGLLWLLRRRSRPSGPAAPSRPTALPGPSQPHRPPDRRR
nr:hypothetical protein [Peterkaempfera griseoplana]